MYAGFRNEEDGCKSPSGLAGSATSPLCEEAFTRAKPAQRGSPQCGELAAKLA